MATFSTINLLRSTPSSLPAELVPVETWLRLARMWVLLLVFCLGLVTALAFFMVRSQVTNAQAERERLQASVRQYQKQEASYVLVKDRLGRIDKILATYKKWAATYGILSGLLDGVTVSSVTTDDLNKITVTFKTPFIEQVANILTELVVQGQNKSIRNPTLESLQLNEDGSLQVKFFFGLG